MRLPLYDHNARRKTVSVTLNADLVARSRALGINISQVAEAALVQAFEAAEKAKIRAELQDDACFVADYVVRHGPAFPHHPALLGTGMKKTMQHDLYVHPHTRAPGRPIR